MEQSPAESAMTMQLGSDQREIILTRIINAPRALVFKAWTDPIHLAAWYGPHGMTNPVCEVDPRPGGAYRIVMRSADGVDYPVKGVFLEVVEPERLVMTSVAYDHPAEFLELLKRYRGSDAGEPTLAMTDTITFEEVGGQTKLTILTRFGSPVDRDAALKLGHAEGMAQCLERLEIHLRGD